MCGINGILGNVSKEDEMIVKQMNDILAYRGPDANKVKRYSGAVLGHTRLSIIDLSDKALQPMESYDKRYVLVFNGEIYNYKEIRKILTDEYDFVSDSDSEVLLNAWMKWKEECLNYLNGMFAFCIYDTIRKTAFIARDRFGQKPIFFTEQNGRLIFSSEVKALLVTGVKALPDDKSWVRYLTTGLYYDDNRTFFKDIQQLKPGECAQWDHSKGLSRYVYYNLYDKVSNNTNNIDIKTAANNVREILVDTANIHMRSDVPVGISLSGGLDSSSLLACINLNNKLNKNISCVSIDYGETLSEKKWIKAAANYYNLESEIESYTIDEFRESIRPLMWHMEGPIGGLPNCGLEKIMRIAKEVGIKVIQDGTGLDEAFGGYHNHHNLYVGTLLRNGDLKAQKALHEYMKNWSIDKSTALKAIEVTMKHNNVSIDGTIPVRPDLIKTDILQIYQDRHNEEYKCILDDPLKDNLVHYLQSQKIPRNTHMKDRVSMAYSIELRLPFLDYRLVEYALNLPTDYYFLFGRTKSVVREALAGYMDDAVRLSFKRSIQAPQGQWLIEEPMKSYILDLINSRSFKDREVFDVKKVKQSYKEFCQGNIGNSFFVWQWINMEEWFRIFIDNSLDNYRLN